MTGKEDAMTFAASKAHGNAAAHAAVLLLLSLSWATAAAAQSPAPPSQAHPADQRGDVAGTVANASGAAVAGARVTATNAETGAQFTTTTDAQGAYAFAALPTGKYTFSVESSGQTAYSRSGVDIAADRRPTIAITMYAAAPGQAVGADTQALLARIDALEQRLRELQARAAAPEASATSALGPSAAGQQQPDPGALADRLAGLEERLSELETRAVLSETTTYVKRVDVWVDANGTEYDQPMPGARQVATYRREAVYRRESIGERIEEALAEAEKRSVQLGIDATSVTQFASRTTGDADAVTGNAYALASADLFFTAGLAQYTVFFADVVALSGAPPDLEIPGLTLLNGYTARLVNQNELNLREVWLRTELFNQRLALVAGRLDLTNYFDSNAAANDETIQFLGDGLVNNPALGLATNGTGFAAVFDPKIGFNFKVGVQQSNAEATNLSDSIYSLAEVGFLATFPSLGEGNYRAWLRATNTGDLNSTAFGLSLDQKVGPVATLFARYGDGQQPVTGEGQTSFSLGQRFYSGGVKFQNGLVFNRWDAWGIGYAHTEVGDTGEKEKLTEGFYNLQLTDRLHLTFHLQHVLRSAPGTPTLGYLVPGLRLQAAF
jgi:hypothetical protein